MGQPEPCRDIKSVSRHHSGQPRSRPQNGVATPFLLPSPKPGSNTKTRSRPSWRVTYVATSISCRDFGSAHSGISRSRRQNPSPDLPHCHPCHDLKNDVATSYPTSQNPRLSSLRPTATQPGRDATSWSRPHVQPNQVTTSNPCRDLNRS